MKVLAVIQARMGSSRLSNKVLLPLAGKTVLEHVVERTQRARRVGGVVVATTVNVDDLAIVRLCAERSISLYIGSEEDVLDRYYQAARLFRADHVVRITADCPAIDPQVIDRVVAEHLTGGSDLTSNVLKETYPDGEDVEVVTFAGLARAWKEATLPSEREHVTPFIKNHPEMFRLGSVANEADLSQMRWTLDNKEDYAFLKKVFNALSQKKKLFGMGEIYKYVRAHPEVAKLNRHIRRNEGYKKSLLQDAR